jgi:hypothetical protein
MISKKEAAAHLDEIQISDQAVAHFDEIHLTGQRVRLTITYYPPLINGAGGAFRVRLWIGGDIVAEGDTITQTINQHREKHVGTK